MPKNEREYRAPALEGGLEVLELLSTADHPMTLTQIANALDKSTSGLFRLLSCLNKMGYVVRDEALGAFSLSFKLYELAHRRPMLQRLIQVAHKPMQDFTEKSGFSCHISMLEGDHVVIVHQVQSPNSIFLHIREGSRFPAHETSTGCLMLAQQSDEELTNLCKGEEHEKLLMQRVRALRKQLGGKNSLAKPSYSLNGIIDISCLLVNSPGKLKASMACTMIESQVKKSMIEEGHALLRETANRIVGAIHD